MCAVRTDQMTKVSVQGACDLHIHSAPSLFGRIGDDWQIARAAADAGMRAIVLKVHHESTVSRAYLVTQKFPGLDVFGGIVLNKHVGGINPAAVDAALQLGGKIVWMPTIDAARHAEIYGSTGTYGLQETQRQEKQGIRVLNENGKLKSEVLEVLELVGQYGAILATAHLFPEEIEAVVSKGKEMGLRNIVITHALAKPVMLDLEHIEHLAGLGAIIELDFASISPMWVSQQGNSVDNVLKTIETVGARKCILVSDAGQRHNPMPAEALRLFAQILYERGVSQEDLRRMMIDNPTSLLGIA